MTTYRIFLSYVNTDTAFVKQLMTDLQTSGAEVVVDSSSIPDEGYVSFLYQQLLQCQWLILIQTPEALQSLRVQATVRTALNLVAQQRMKGVLRLIDSSSDTERGNELSTWAATRKIPNSPDYPKVLERVLLEIDPTKLDNMGLEDLPPRLGLPVSSPNPPISQKKTPKDLGSSSSSNMGGDRRTPGKVDGSHSMSLSKQQPHRSRLILFSLAMVLVLVVAGVTVFSHPDNRSLGYATLTPTLTQIITPTPMPIPTPTPTPTLTSTPSDILARATSGQPFIDDPLQSQNGNRWSENTSNLGVCEFRGGRTYHASLSYPDQYTPCLALADRDSNLQNIAFQAQMTIIQGDVGGLIFHSNASGSNGYAFTICVDPVCRKGYYGLYMSQGNGYSQLISGSSTAIKADLNQTNLLTVVALNGDIYLYVNDKSVAHIHDNTFVSAYIGLTAYELSNSTDVSFSNAQVWKL